MCGFVVHLRPDKVDSQIEMYLGSLKHRGPDDYGIWKSPSGLCSMGHRRLSIIDLSEAGRQPMKNQDGRFHIVFNGEIYNYIELRNELGGTQIQTKTDTEVLLAAYIKWGVGCLDKLIGMFSFSIWDEEKKELFAARDRFGVKPLYISENGKAFLLASEIKAMHAAGISRHPDEETWATYLSSGFYDHSEFTFWKGIKQVPAGTYVRWSLSKGIEVNSWYELSKNVLDAGDDNREEKVIYDELYHLLMDSIELRFRADVPVGICLSGGLDSSLLLALVQKLQGPSSEINTFTFYCDDNRYDELPWVRKMLLGTRHSQNYCKLDIKEVNTLANKVQYFQDEPYGGMPTLGMAMVHKRAKKKGVTVLLDGNGLDESWAGYEYYMRADNVKYSMGPVQGAKSPTLRADCLKSDFAKLTRTIDEVKPFNDVLRDLQYRDIKYAKIPRAMRFADRVSMMYSRELREPFLDHRIVELGLRQPKHNKVRKGIGKWLPRKIAEMLLPTGITEAPKRPVQTPQREWLMGPLAGWAELYIEEALAGIGRNWLESNAVRDAWKNYKEYGADNSFPIWQLISLGMISK